MRILITGISGFIGSHLAEYINSNLKQNELYGLIRPRSSLANLKKVSGQVRYYTADLMEFTSLLSPLDEIRPDLIFHLAGQGAPSFSWSLPAGIMEVNLVGTINLLEALRELRLNPRVIIAGAGEAYGLASADELPMKESSHFRPLNPFGVSKAAQDMLGFQYFKSYNLKIIRVRPFSTIGPRQPEYCFTSGLAKQIAEIEKKKKDPILYAGNLENKRDYTDVRDLVRALWQVAEKGEEGEAYNLGSGQAWFGNEILKILLGMTRAKIVIETEEKRLRPADPPILLADINRLVKLTGWKPQINLKQSLLDVLNYWREEI
ncbi:MAG TPA: GDP-mannose 4,6-dehydratase [Candidatus Saccharicenans sp.]|jgi:GDP-4-dehydro-6-deoxy-D-mannose reductase|nr:GDP-mannose 4,6-dehydratase [Candidatus Saccharicenans sp.]HRD01540.1 GDP-mannose 4,6-dehydratase [Candidatus Saccharicenans sp.]